VPQLFVEVDEAKVIALGIPLASVYETLQSTMGALYVNDFNKAGRFIASSCRRNPSTG
jgi:multidrug efflux pump subunit AcrB